MNKELELEAVDWIKNTSQYKSVKSGFIAGATSKYVEKQKLEFTIEILKSLEPTDYDVEYGNTVDLRHFRNELRKTRVELGQKLKTT